jgi:murein L,D-transpeptidase YafK
MVLANGSLAVSACAAPRERINVKQISFSGTIRRLAVLGVAAVALAGCQASDIPKHLKPVPGQLIAKMGALEMKETAEIFIRIFKESSELEVWKETADGTFALLTSYDVCKWSGELGPKRKEGDRQAPEGFYTVAPAQMNPNSSYYLSFNIGYPNTFDKSLGRTGSHLMVHGACSSAGCYSMTDEAAGEIFSLARDSFRGGQRAFHIQAFPFRMTPENLARHRDNPNMDFWKMLKVGYDNFEITRQPPKIDVCGGRYVFNANAGGAAFDPNRRCPVYKLPPKLESALAQKEASDSRQLALAIAVLEAKTGKEARQAKTALAAEKKTGQSTLMSRLLGRDEEPLLATPVAIDKVTPITSTPTVAAPVAPVPLLKQTDEPALTTTASIVEPQTTVVPEEELLLSKDGTPIVAVGQFVKRDFNWPEG